MIRKVLGLFIAFLFIYSIAFASVAIQKNGVDDGVATTLNIVGLSNENDGSTWTIGNDIEVATAGDTLVTADSGKVIVYKPTTLNTAATFNLPGATEGLVYTFVQSSIGRITVNPQNSDTIRYLTLDAGDSIVGPAATSDSVRLICYATGYWAIRDRVGTWTDGS